MTSKNKCPFCQQELHKDPDGYYSCYTDNCSVMSAGGNGAGGTESLWTALIQAKQDLEIATNALEDIDALLLSSKFDITELGRLNIIQYLVSRALKLTEHKEEQDG